MVPWRVAGQFVGDVRNLEQVVIGHSGGFDNTKCAIQLGFATDKNTPNIDLKLLPLA